MNLYSTPELKVGDPDETYMFYISPKEHITVQFSKWDGDIIEEATFTIQKSETYRKFKATAKCVKGIDGKDEIRLALHSLLALNATPRTQALPVDKLQVKNGEKIRFCYINYFEGESYDDKYSCVPYGTIGVPDVKKGGVVLRP